MYTNGDYAWMRYSVDLMKQSSHSGVHVAAILISLDNDVLCYGVSSDSDPGSWCTMLSKQIIDSKISNARSIYLTTNTLSQNQSFDLNKILKRVCIKDVYIGLPDPRLSDYLANDPVLAENRPYRYALDLQREILAFNDCFYSESKQCIKNSPYFCANRISNLVAEKLSMQGIILTKNELDNNKSPSALSLLISEKYGKDHAESSKIVNAVISEAFNSKYGSYNYLEDTRALESKWKNNFMSVYHMSNSKPMNELKILNVGVGSGHEAFELFRNHTDITFVDISKTGLSNVKKKIPLSKTINTSADNLGMISDESCDLYISLRTYNSSFFDIHASVSEAYRVLKFGARLLISVANGFLSRDQQRILPGLIIPGTEFVDIYRGFDMANLIYKELIDIGFNEVKIFPSNTEIYLSAQKSINQQLDGKNYPPQKVFCKI